MYQLMKTLQLNNKIILHYNIPVGKNKSNRINSIEYLMK